MDKTGSCDYDLVLTIIFRIVNSKYDGAGFLSISSIHFSGAYMRVVFFLLSSVILCASMTAQDFSETSHFARAISLGNAYTGVAEGVEAFHYNTAGIADLDHASIIYSQGVGEALLYGGIVSDYAVAAPIPSNIGVAGFSYMRFSFDEADLRVFSLNGHYARSLTSEISAGLDAHYYHSSCTAGDRDPEKIKVSGFDISPSLLYTFRRSIIGALSDRLRLGIVMRNALGLKSSVTFESKSGTTTIKEHNFQVLRAGASYRVTPPFNNIASFVPMQLLISGDAVFIKYIRTASFAYWQPNFGFEMTLFEILRIRYGRENEKLINDSQELSAQYPVTRYGIGAAIPLSRMMEKGIPVGLEIDYSISDWQKIDENTGLLYVSPNSCRQIPIKKTAFSVKVNAAL